MSESAANETHSIGLVWRFSSIVHCVWARGSLLSVCLPFWAGFRPCRRCFFLCSCASLWAGLFPLLTAKPRLTRSLSYNLCQFLRNAIGDVLAAVAAPPRSVSPSSRSRPALCERSARTRAQPSATLTVCSACSGAFRCGFMIRFISAICLPLYVNPNSASSFRSTSRNITAFHLEGLFLMQPDDRVPHEIGFLALIVWREIGQQNMALFFAPRRLQLLQSVGQLLRDTQRTGIANRRIFLLHCHRSATDGSRIKDPRSSRSRNERESKSLFRYHARVRHQCDEHFVKLRENARGITYRVMNHQVQSVTDDCTCNSQDRTNPKTSSQLVNGHGTEKKTRQTLNNIDALPRSDLNVCSRKESMTNEIDNAR